MIHRKGAKDAKEEIASLRYALGRLLRLGPARAAGYAEERWCCGEIGQTNSLTNI
jgi:hypothetical protein